MKKRRPCVELAGGVGELSFDLARSLADGVELGLDLGLRPAGLADQVEVVLLLGVELAQPGAQALLEGIDAAEFAQQCVLQLCANRGLEVVA